MTVRAITQPTVEPITLTQAKLHCDIPATFTDHDALISSMIVAARQYAERYTHRAFIQRTFELTLPSFPNALLQRTFLTRQQQMQQIELPFPPLVSVSWVKYLELDGTVITLDPTLYQVDSYREPALLQPAYLQVWPIVTRPDFNAVQIRYVAGYAPVGSPDSDADYAAHPDLETLKQWMRMRVATMYDNPQFLAQSTVKELDDDYVDGMLDEYQVSMF